MLAENAQSGDISNPTSNPKSASREKGVYVLDGEDDLNTKVAGLTKKVKAIELRSVNMITTSEAVESVCGICESDVHLTKDCPTIPAFQDILQTQSNATNAYQRPFSGPNSNLTNPEWRCKLNFNGRNGPMVNTNNASQGPPQKSTLEDTLNAFMIGQT